MGPAKIRAIDRVAKLTGGDRWKPETKYPGIMRNATTEATSSSPSPKSLQREYANEIKSCRVADSLAGCGTTKFI